MAWQDYQSQREGVQWQNQVQRFNRYGYRKEQRTEDRETELEETRRWLQLSNPLTDSQSYEFCDKEPEVKTEAEDILVKQIPSFRGASPHQFSNFVPDDTTVIAERAYESIVTPLESRLVAFY
ncbi:hypothetical protein SH528x_000085 [Novipirellula sp. SH528]|uniref:hypothetical protein n=1 Tax=Novipirellula sp. SH528 TaxID=3454466 RepID=UPI003FA0DF86